MVEWPAVIYAASVVVLSFVVVVVVVVVVCCSGRAHGYEFYSYPQES